ncbi:hypothetical protein Ct61P_14640 [Colletotrichum tofieldiae]|nr:hypothetical protein Ct61P_14640 [Colletotrichum tofieldiae]
MADWDQTSDGQAPGTPDTGLAKQLWAERNHGTITPRRERRLQQYTDRLAFYGQHVASCDGRPVAMDEKGMRMAMDPDFEMRKLFYET